MFLKDIFLIFYFSIKLSTYFTGSRSNSEYLIFQLKSKVSDSSVYVTVRSRKRKERIQQSPFDQELKDFSQKQVQKHQRLSWTWSPLSIRKLLYGLPLANHFCLWKRIILKILSNFKCPSFQVSALFCDDEQRNNRGISGNRKIFWDEYTIRAKILKQFTYMQKDNSQSISHFLL